MANNKEEEIYNNSVIQSGEGICLDTDPVDQPIGTTRFTLNMVEEATDGQIKYKSNEKSIYIVGSFTDGFIPIGDEYMGNDSTAIILKNPTTNKDEIGIVNKNDVYTPIVNTGVLGLSITHQCDIRFRIRKGNQRVIYWVDGLNKARAFNFEKINTYYSIAYNNYILAGGDPSLFTGEKWDALAFDLTKNYALIPEFGTMTILESGTILSGSYNFAIQLVDENLNPTTWITTSNTVNIYNDTTSNVYGTIRGSRNVQTPAQTFAPSDKSITVKVSNLDTAFPFFRVAIIRATGNNGTPDKVLLSQLYSTSSSSFTYSGNDAELSEVPISDIEIEPTIIYAPKHIEQEENRLILANGNGKGVNWCDFQTYASRISSDVIYQSTILNNINSNGNVKNGNSTWISRGYMPGEVYSFGIVWIFDDNTLSPGFHIPGKSNDSGESSNMKVYELNTNYLDIHNCSTNNYWGADHLGNTLVGKPIRHHRFPFRHEVGKPLVTSTGGSTDITKYKLSVVFSLNPAWTPGPPSYPTDGGSPPVDLLINYILNYQITGGGSPTGFAGELVDTDVSNAVEIIVYDDTVALDFITGSQYTTINSASELYTFNPGTNNRFIITETYTSYVSSTAYNTDIADIFGIKFSNIQRPRADIIGFYIVRNDRKTNDRLIIDTAIFGPTTTFAQAGIDIYTSFGLIMPKQYYHVSACGASADSGKTLTYSNKSLWFFNPEFEYFGNKLNYTGVVVEGTYTEKNISLPTISDVANSPCNSGGSKGIYINDVQAGTTYDPSVNKKKNKDDDGFDLIIGYRNTDVTFTLDDGTTVLPDISQVSYLNAASSFDILTNTYYNVSIDNKIGMYISNDTYDNTKLTNAGGVGKNALYYAALTLETSTAYSDFMARAYYKEHNNPVFFDNAGDTINNFNVFNGDVAISGMSFTSSVYYDIVVANRPKKSSLWNFIIGGLLIVAGAILTIASVGLLSSVGAMAIGLGVSLVASGIKLDQLESMINTHYDLGLRDTVTDGAVFETIRAQVETEDDTIRWFADRVSNIYMESSVPFGLRSGLTGGLTDFINAPMAYDEPNFRSYLIEKLTTIDRNQGSGRLYRGYAQAEFYDMNLDYMRFNREKNFIHLPIEYDCCTDPNEVYPVRRWYSEQSFQEENIDNYGIFLPNNYSDMEGETGQITGMYRLGNNLYMHTEESLWQQPQNLQEKTTSEFITFLGTGEFLAIPPRKVLDDELGSPGSKHKWATVKTPSGVAFIDEIEHKIWLQGDKIQEISAYGLRSYFQNNLVPNLALQIYTKLEIEFTNDNNPANPNGIGYHATYDKRYNRILFTKRDYALLPNVYAILNKIDTIPTTEGTFNYCTLNGLFYDGTTIISLENSDYFENKSFTISYSLNNHKFPWISWHNYLPNYYIRTQNSLYSYKVGTNNIWKHHLEGNYHVFYGINYGIIIELVKTNELSDKMIEDFTVQCNTRIWDATNKQYIDSRFNFFNKLIVYNSRQSTGLQNIIVKDTQANPQNWYQQQISNVPQEILATRKGRNWHVNDLRDYVIDYTKPLFSSSWLIITQSNYFIDKVINSTVIDYNKNWNEVQSFSDKYIVIRLIFDNFNNINLVLNYTINTEQNTDE